MSSSKWTLVFSPVTYLFPRQLGVYSIISDAGGDHSFSKAGVSLLWPIFCDWTVPKSHSSLCWPKWRIPQLRGPWVQVDKGHHSLSSPLAHQPLSEGDLLSRFSTLLWVDNTNGLPCHLASCWVRQWEAPAGDGREEKEVQVLCSSIFPSRHLGLAMSL